MSVDLGDRTEDSIIYFMWSTNAADGSSITRTTDGTISVYKNDDVTQSVAGITDTEDFDSLTGIHLCKIDTSADAFYAAAEDYTIIISGATIDGKSVNAVLAVFSIENRFMRGTDSAAIEANVEGHVNTSLSAYNSPTDDEMIAAFTEIKGATWAAGTDTLEHIRNKQTDIETDTGEIGTAGAGLTDLGGMSTGMKGEVNTEVADVITVDTTSEPPQGPPPETPTFEQMFAYMYFKLRNKTETTATEDAMYDNAGTTKIMKAALTDNGTTFTKAEYVSGA